MIGELAALAGAFTWAITSIMIKDPIIKVGAVTVNTVRTWIGAGVFVSLMLITGETEQLFAIPLYNAFALVASMILGLGIGDTLYFASLRHIGVAKSMPISGSYPLPTLLLAAIFLGEPLTWIRGLGTIVILASVYLISMPSRTAGARLVAPDSAGTSVRKGFIFSGLAALLWACATVLLKSGVGTADLIVSNSLRLTAAAIVLTLMAFRQPGGLKLRGFGWKTLGVIALSGVIGTALGSALYLTAVTYAGAGKASALQTVAPFFAAPLALIFLKERINHATLIGTALSVVGVWLLIGF